MPFLYRSCSPVPGVLATQHNHPDSGESLQDRPQAGVHGQIRRLSVRTRFDLPSDQLSLTIRTTALKWKIEVNS
jgi:hypothetical protein